MKYITYKRFKSLAMCGDVNIPALSECECIEGMITWKREPICYCTSENGHNYFAVDEDGNGLERGRLTSLIKAALAKKDASHDARWERIWADPTCWKYKHKGFADWWLWGHDFYIAPIDDLRYIAHLIGVSI